MMKRFFLVTYLCTLSILGQHGATSTACYQYKDETYQSFPYSESESLFVIWRQQTSFLVRLTGRCISECDKLKTACQAVAMKDGKCLLLNSWSSHTGYIWTNDGTWTIYSRKGEMLEMPIFRVSEATSVDVAYAWQYGTTTQQSNLWTRLNISQKLSENSLFRHGLIDNWNYWNFSEIVLSFYTDNNIKAFVSLRANGTTSDSWFNASNLVYSSWDDLYAGATVDWFGLTLTSPSVSFGIQESNKTCNATESWLMALDSSNGCSWANFAHFPMFLYSPYQNKCAFAENHGKANDLVVTVMMPL